MEQSTDPISEAAPRKPELVYGVKAISEVIDEPSERRTYYLLENGLLPGAGKMGRIWYLSVPAFRRAVHGEAA